ncbi:cytosine permease [Nocardia sp. NEAU-G5]|uniref:Cytosine permease n=1 Tax=Nocardia albiluteola TaxID=2842303 RepID=A0ABS6B9G6_9NOCA|nr:cytosine permease [Nocardia albiluteola]MBU3066951.1 cytosine permease [Nocardia albiluteola]
MNFLLVLGYLFTPWTAINLVDFYVVRRGHYSIREIVNPRGIYHRWNWRGLPAYGVGFAAMMPIGLAVAAGVYLLVCRSLDLTSERDTVTRADEGLEPEAVAVG